MITLITIWHLREVLLRLQCFFPMLREACAHSLVVAPPDTDVGLISEVEALGITLIIPKEWSVALIETERSSIQESHDEKTRRWYNRRVVIRNGVRKDKPFYIRLYDEVEI